MADFVRFVTDKMSYIRCVGKKVSFFSIFFRYANLEMSIFFTSNDFRAFNELFDTHDVFIFPSFLIVFRIFLSHFCLRKKIAARLLRVFLHNLLNFDFL